MRSEDGIAAVLIARKAIVGEVTFDRDRKEIELSNNDPTGVFVTINTFPALRLRGCIGFPGPAYPLRDAVENAARAACHDPRFLDLDADELNDIVVEVTILSPPEPIKVTDRKDLLDMIKLGKHGLMLEYRGRRSVFLPQVPEEWGWDVKEYLENLCVKAGVGKNKWKEHDCNLMWFEGHVFKETSPNGDVAEVKE